MRHRKACTSKQTGRLEMQHMRGNGRKIRCFFFINLGRLAFEKLKVIVLPAALQPMKVLARSQHTRWAHRCRSHVYRMTEVHPGG
jgi:hypothetical protein